MKTTIFILFMIMRSTSSYGGGGYTISTVEFSSKEKCEAAGELLKKYTVLPEWQKDGYSYFCKEK